MVHIETVSMTSVSQTGSDKSARCVLAPKNTSCLSQQSTYYRLRVFTTELFDCITLSHDGIHISYKYILLISYYEFTTFHSLQTVYPYMV